MSLRPPPFRTRLLPDPLEVFGCVCFDEVRLQEGGAAAAGLWRPGNHSHQCAELPVQVSPASSGRACARADDDGHTCRWTYIEFYSRYSILMSQQEADLSDKKQTCKTVLQRVIQVGLSAAQQPQNKAPLLTRRRLRCRADLRRTPTSTSLAAQRSSSAPARWRIWRSCAWTGSGEPA